MDFVRVFEDYHKYIYAYAYKLTNGKQQAEDLTQETFLKAYQKMHQLRDNDSVRFWLRRICFNTYLMQLRKQNHLEIPFEEMQVLQQQGRGLGTDDEPPGAADEIIIDETIRSIQQGCFLTMVHLLTDNQRIVFSLVDMFGLTIAEAGEVLDITASAAKALLHRARTKLDKFFSQNCGVIDVDNPCKCRAWEEFALQREQMKKRFAEGKTDRWTEVPKFVKQSAKRKIRYLYASMPDHKPSDEWYASVLDTLKSIC